MAFLLLQILAFVAASYGYMCPAPEVCKCEESLMLCICDSRQDITISAVLNFDIRHVVVRGCGWVTIPLGALTHLHLETVELSDIVHLNVRPFAFAGIPTISSLVISDIENFDVQQHGFSGLFNVSTITLSNVNTEVMATGAFGGLSDIEYFSIEKSQFQIVEELAFILTNVTTFKVVNTHIHTLLNMSFLVHNSEIVSFHDTIFSETGNNSFAMDYVDKLVFENCIFGTLGTTSILTKSLGTFSFQKCTIQKVDSDAFTSVEVIDNVYFMNNVIKIADQNSLIPNNGVYIPKHINMDVSGNHLMCNCGISWIWESLDTNNTTPLNYLYDEFREKNFCIGDTKEKLSSLTLVLDDNMECMTLAKKTFQEKSTDFIDSIVAEDISASYANTVNSVLNDFVFILLIAQFLK